MNTSQRVAREVRRFSRQLVNVTKHGKFNPFTRMRRANKPRAIIERPGLEIDSPLEFIAEHVANTRGEFKFVLIGAFDGVLYDTLPQLAIKKQWKGILVEPQPIAFEKLRAACAGITHFTLENLAIGDEAGTLEFFTSLDGASNLASFDREHLLRFGTPASHIQSIQVRVETITSLLKRHQYETLELLQIDTEGYDGQIIRSIDFTSVKPNLIRYEHLNMVEHERSDLIRLLAQHGYRFMLEDNDTIAYCQ